MKVQLDFNICRKPHSLYHSFFNNPPEGIEYTKSEFIGINQKSYSTIGKIRKKIVFLFPFIEKLDRTILSFIRKESGVDLIHFTFHLGKSDKPSVIDYEHAYNFIDTRDTQNLANKKRSIKILNKGNIKYLMPINKEALKSFELFFDNEVKIPQEVVYPTIFIPEKYRNPVKKKNRVVFIGSSNISTDEAFAMKGGYETVLAFNNLAKKFKDYEFIIVSKIPYNLISSKEENLIIKGLLPQNELWKIMNESKIFVQPNYHTPAMAFLEAMFFKLPIIAYDCWANGEYVDISNGILVTPKNINHINKDNIPRYPKKTLEKIRKNAPVNSKKIEKAIEKLIKNPSLCKKLGEAGYSKVIKGKFSIKKRNDQIKRIYEESIK